MEEMTTENEMLVESAFTRQSVIFDQIYQDNTIIGYKRRRVRDHILRYVKAGGQLLELNSGTGEDALFFAEKGFSVHATDISVGMQAELRKKVVDNGLEAHISQETCSFTQLDRLENKGPYDLIYSNFAGLNCTGVLGKVLSSFAGLLKDDGMITLVVLPKFCLWETLLIFKGKFKTAFRRFFSANGRDSHLEGIHFKCWYYQPSFIKKHLEADFEVLGIEGLCTIVPPSYIENFAEKYPVVYRVLLKLENRWKGSWPWRSIGDYYIISLKKKAKILNCRDF
jgi:ubiquinone/menaquinone biosynthesis C-methylase UbiE